MFNRNLFYKLFAKLKKLHEILTKK